MLLKDMFQKDIERDIRGVIKVAQTDDDSIYQELDEYVVTRELQKHLSKFYENYQRGVNGSTDKMGVWISGFFGSGKSHFLKILSYLLENKEIQNRTAVDFFDEKIQDPIVLANMQRTAGIETETILFNIDAKAQLDNKSKEDAILRVFMKVFYEHRGYYGDISGVAEMEKYLDKQGTYEVFKESFKNLAGESWEDRRNSFYFDRDYIVSALSEATDMTEESAGNWFDNGVNNYEISIEKFAKDVKEYIDQKGPNFHLIFLVDEIGQYIGDSRSLMLNLQTLTEELGTHAKGKAWVMVTSQESIDSIVKVKGDDFSRIQGRFDTRLSLSSISVDEVLKKRILLKKNYVNDKLKLLYPEKSAILKNLISFRESTADLRGYDNEQEFADVYPFVPYQFKLLQNVFEQIRKHGSSGKSLSEGERSMLSAYKETALRYKGEEEGFLIPFPAFYETVKEFLNPTVSRVIEGAYENPALKDDHFNMELLKVLFMVKYIKELPANIDNLATLMITNIDEDKLALKEKIKVSLRKLISQTLIQKNGDFYLFLTDDEQDINREIKTLNVDEELVKRELADYVFQDLYDEKRFRYSSEYLFSFNQKMDEKNYGNQSSSIGVQIVSPLSDHYQKSEQELMMMTSGSGEMIVKLGGSELYVEEIEEAIRIESYRKKKNITQLPENIQNILNNKTAEARERKNRSRALLEDAIKSGTFFINGDKVEIKGSTVKEKFNAAFKMLVDNIYTKLNYVKEHMENERGLIHILASDNDQISFEDTIGTYPNELAKKEIFDFITLQNDIQKQVRVKIIYDRFQDKPYGWRQLDIAAMIAKLLKEQRIRVRYNAEYLEPEQKTTTLVSIFSKTAEAEKAIILKRVQVDEALIRTAKRVAKDVFNKTDLADDEDGLVKDLRFLIEEQIAEINDLKSQYEGKKYPGKSLLDKGLEYFTQFHNGLDNASFFTKLKELEDDLAYWEEDIVLVQSFFGSNQIRIFDQGLAVFEKYKENQAYLNGEEIESTVKDLASILEDSLPYRKIKDIPELVHKIEEHIKTVLLEKKKNAEDRIADDKVSLTSFSSQYGVSNETKQEISYFYKHLLEDLDSYTDIHRVESSILRSSNFKVQTENKINRELEEWLRRKRKEQKEQEGGTIQDGDEPTEIPVQKEFIQVLELISPTPLTTEAEVDLYLENLSQRLKAAIKNNKQIEFRK
ncbi:BREX system P-loop protein BrxC [Planococcus sp. CP5-4]|uniref:BREX system P-loop protein BrxC n=1 Tax=unclassified Planococcus (in: firmicutes) TaxID=2662419 RepID=UPI001C24DDE6|nr:MULTISPECIES: BREX system P-loop protein BrxC [unclassified Planococcus (in: firmicutes)]MBU9673997.1 BREX system P-loop protein BrxC [Planococcus sp. CP5-4_YE]MBV0909868.1 BREX system P-loop protein BrxC [Planococcus sp. CP5-4_UN]MBW6064748.1 BREX system P-loop protein BrxC [Planococcus sp. CP5-4]